MLTKFGILGNRKSVYLRNIRNHNPINKKLYLLQMSRRQKNPKGTNKNQIDKGRLEG